MRIEVDGGGYDTASEALFGANHSAATHYNALVGKLREYGAIAGDDRSSEDFVANYDTAARDAVRAVSDLVDAFATLGILSAASIDNHRNANASSVYGKPTPVYDGGTLPGDGPLDVSEFTPPSALGGDAEDLPEFWNLITDYLEGWAWPGADTGRLREAGTAWRTAATNLGGLTYRCDVAVNMFEGQRSPEIPLAIDATRDLETQVTELTAELKAIGDACDDYAEQVEQTRETIKDLLRDLAVEAGITVVVGGVVTFFTAGLGAGGTAAVAGWRLSACARKIVAALTALKAVRAVTLMARTGPQLRTVRSALAKYKDIRAVRLARKSVGDKLWTPGKFASNPKNALAHFKKHRGDFPDCPNARDYVDRARQFMSDPPPGTLTKVRDSGGDIIRYDPKSNTLGIIDKDGTLKTMFKPDPNKHKHATNLDYFHAQ